MFNPFPELLDWSFVAPTILRVAAALTLWYLAHQQWRRREEMARMHTAGLPAMSAVFNLTVGVMLFFGYYTQIAAILGIVGALAGLFQNRRNPHTIVLPNSTALLLVAIYASLLLSGAGAFAFDLPL